MDWQSTIDKLMAVEATPVTRLQNEQARNSEKNDALTLLNTKMTALQVSMTSLKDVNLYKKRDVSSSDTTSSWAQSAEDGTAVGAYSFAVSQLATAAKLNGNANIASAIDPDSQLASLTTGTAITAGAFSVNGSRITIALTDTLNDVLTRIGTATNGAVTASYDATTDAVKLTSTVSGQNVVLGAANDTSNFLGVMQLRNNDTGTVVSNEDTAHLGTSLAGLGSVSLSSTLANARLTTALAGQSSDGNGVFTLNGVDITYNTQSDSLNAIISKINTSNTGVTASYDAVNDRMVLTNNSTGDIGFSVSDTTGNLVAALGLDTASGAKLVAGKDAIFSVNGGGNLYSRTNTLDSSTHGITGLTVSITSATTQTITVSASASALSTAINSFISKYNDVQDYIEEQTKITSTSSKVTAEVLSNNSEVNEYARTLRSTAFATRSGLSGTIDQLDDLGIDFRSGTDKLEIKDTAKFNSALNTNASSVMEFFTDSTHGIGAAFGSFFSSSLGTTTSKGSLTYMIDDLTAANKSIDSQIETINKRLAEQRTILEESFSRMEDASAKSTSLLTLLSKNFFSSSSN
jgi:flagellar hook-associated protein 2